MEYKIRKARRHDLASIVKLLADDDLGSGREIVSDILDEAYIRAFEAIDADDRHELIVIDSIDGVIGTLQLSILPNLTYKGRPRAQIEGVRVSKSHQGKGLGRDLFTWAIDRSRELGVHVVQLNSDKRRPDAIRFYESLGFKTSHEGMKLHLG